MEQDRVVGGGGRGVEMRGTNKQEHPPPPQQPQKCPRCDSLNTKFCYYNNYSLSQPRFFCKTCRRYWTQGGTLRNVPVGGGCRKGKRLKRSSSPENLNTTSSLPQQNVQNSNPSTTSAVPLRSTKGIESVKSSPMLPIAAVSPSMYYPGGGFFPSLAAFQSFNQQPQINVGGEFGAVSNLALLQGFGHLPFHTQQMQHHAQQQQQQQQVQQRQQQHLHLHQQHDFKLGISSTSSGSEEKVIQPNRPSTSHQEWSQSFNTTIPPITSESSYWSSNTNTNTTTINTTSTTTPSTTVSSLNPTHWIDHSQGYGPPTSTTTPSTTVSLNPTQWIDHLQGYGPPPSTTTTSSSPPSFL